MYSGIFQLKIKFLFSFQFSFLQWLLVITAATLSGTALVIVLRPAIKNSRYSMILIIGVVAAHFLLACSFMTYFFHVPGGAGQVASPTVQSVVENAVAAVKANATVIAAGPPVAV